MDIVTDLANTFIWVLFAILTGGLISVVGVLIGSWIQSTLEPSNGPYKVTVLTYVPVIAMIIILFSILSH